MGSTVGYMVEEITKSHVEEVRQLWDELKAGKEFRKSREKIWEQSERQYRGKTWKTAAEDPTADHININMSFSTVNTILPHLTGMEPEFIVSPFSKDATPKNARIQEAFLNRMWRYKPVGAQLALRQAAFNYVVHGDGFLKTTYQIVDRKQSIDRTGQVTEMFVDRISPWDVWIDPYSTGIDSARWVAVRIWSTEQEARQDETLKIPSAFQFTTLDPGSASESDQGEKPYALSSTQRKWVVLYELYDLVEKKMYVVPEMDPHPWKVVEGITVPVEQIGGYPIPQSPYHMGDLEQIWDVQLEIDKTRSQQITHRARNTSKVFMKDGAFDEEARSALTSSIVGEIVRVTGDQPLNDLVHVMQLQPLPNESYASIQQAQQDLYEISGISEYQRGTAPDMTRTATEAQIMQGSSNVKIDSKLNDIEHALRNIGTYMLGIATDVYPTTDVDEMAMFVGGTDGKAISEMQAGEDVLAAEAAGDGALAAQIAETSKGTNEVTITPAEEIFQGVFEVSVQHSSTDALSPKVKADKYRSVMQLLAEMQPMLQASGVNVDFGRITRLWLEAEKIPGVEAILNGVAPAPDPSAAPQPGPPSALAPSGALPSGGGGGQSLPPDLPPELMQQLMEMMGGGAPIGPDNSGALDPNSYPLVG